MIDHIVKHTIPAAATLLPAKMASSEATALLLAIGLQESEFVTRRQRGHGPARGFWQFEVAGVQGVLEHDRSNGYIASVLLVLRYDHNAPAAALQPALEHNDVLACAFARCLLWTEPMSIPGSGEPGRAWAMYERLWRPGKPRRETWDAYFEEAWQRTLYGRPMPPQPRKVD